MRSAHSFLHLKRQFPREIWFDLLIMLRQDARVWERLADSDFLQRALEALPFEPDRWSPASLCLVEFDQTITLTDLLTKQLQPLPASERKEAIDAYRRWVRNGEEELSLKQAALLALALYEHRQIKGSWDDIGKALPLSRKLTPTVLSCLYGMVPDADEMLNAFIDVGEDSSRADLVIHVVLSNLHNPQTQVDKLAMIVERSSMQRRVSLIQALERQRAWLASLLTRVALERSLIGKQIEGETPAPCPEQDGDYRWLVWQFDNLGRQLQSAEVERLADQPAQAAISLAGIVKELRLTQGRLAALFAQVVDQAQGKELADTPFDLRKAELEAWKQAVQLAPQESAYIQRLAQTLIDSGRFEESRATLVDCQASSPVVAWLEAQIAAEEGDALKAGQAAWHAVELIEHGAAFPEQGFVALAHFFAAEGLPEEAMRAAQLGLKAYPFNLALLGLLTKLQLETNRPDQALLNITLAQAVNQAADESPQQERLQRLLVDSLEGVSAWEMALEERERLLADQINPSRDDLFALAQAAQRAGKDERVLQVCQQLLEEFPEDGPTYGLAAETAFTLGNTDLAVEYFRQAVRYIPARGDWWLMLARLHQQREEDEEAVIILRAAAQAAPEHAGVHLALGEAFLRQDAPTQALIPLRRAVNLAPSAYNDLRLGQALYRLGHLEEASEVLARAYQGEVAQEAESVEDGYRWELEDQDQQELVRLFAQVAIAQQNDALAIPLLEELIREEPDIFEHRIALAQALLRHDKELDSYQRVLDTLEPVIASGAQLPADLTVALAESQALYAEALATAGELDQSMDVYSKVMKSNLVRQPGWQTRLSLGLGRVALKLEQPNLALEVLGAAVRDEPYNPDLHQALYDASLAAGETERAFRTAQSLRDMRSDDADTLKWFVDQALRLADQPEGDELAARQAAVEALRSAISIAPQRGDFPLRLATLLNEEQDIAGAREVYERLVREPVVEGVAAVDYRRAAENAVGWGAEDLSIALYYKAIGLARQSESQEDKDLATDLYTELAQVHRRQGDIQAALAAYDQGITLNPTQGSLYILKADMLLAERSYDQAEGSLEEALIHNPRDAKAHYRMARVKRLLADLPSAFHHAVQAVTGEETPQEERFAYPARLQAAQLANLSLRPRQARAYLWEDPLAEPSTTISAEERSDARYEHAILQAELALGERDLETAAGAVELVSQLKPEHPRSLAASSRLANLNGDRERAEHLFQASQRALETWNPPWEGLPPDAEWEYIGCVNGQCQAALDLRLWSQAYDLACRRRNTKEPLAQFLQAKALVLQAEEQSLCETLDVTHHAPGPGVLAEDAVLAYEKAIQESDRQVQAIGILEESEEVDLWGDEAVQMLRTWRARGQAVFDPTLMNAGILQAALRMGAPEPEDVAALLLAFLRAGEPARAIQAVRSEWPALIDHPHVMVYLALALKDVDPEQAFDLANRSLTLSLKNMCVQCIDQPIIRYLVARLAFTTGDMQAAEESILAALAEWPDESRWHALAAAIYLALNADAQQGARLPQNSKALPHLQQAACLEPQELTFHLQLGRAYRQEGDLAKALDAYQNASELDAECLEPWLAQAEIQRDLGEVVKAAACADRAIEISPDQVAPFVLRAELAILLNNPRGALSRAQAALRIDPHQPQALFLLAQALDALDRPVEALEALEKALPMFNGSLQMQVMRLDLVRRTRGLEIALPHLRDLAEHYPQEPLLAATLAEWLAERGDIEEAMQKARVVLSADPDSVPDSRSADMHFLIGRQMRSKGQLDQAVHHLSKATNGLSGGHPNLEAYLELGRAHQDRREYRQALDAYQAAIDMEEEDFRPFFYAGQVLKDMKEYLQAEKMLRRAAFLAPDEVSVHRLLGAVVALNLVHNRNLAAMDG